MRELAQAVGVERLAVDDGQVEEHATPTWVGAALIRRGEMLHGGWQRLPSAAMPGMAKAPDLAVTIPLGGK